MVLGVGAGHCFPIPVIDVEVQNQVSMGFTLHEPLKVFFNKKSHRTWPVRKFPGLFSVYHGSISGMNTRSTGNHCARLWKDFYENG